MRVQCVDAFVCRLSYTYLHTRMLKNPMAYVACTGSCCDRARARVCRYGVTYNEKQMDPDLVAKRQQLIVNAANRLDQVRDCACAMSHTHARARTRAHTHLHSARWCDTMRARARSRQPISVAQRRSSICR
jgi:hypothetical protein